MKNDTPSHAMSSREANLSANLSSKMYAVIGTIIHSRVCLNDAIQRLEKFIKVGQQMWLQMCYVTCESCPCLRQQQYCSLAILPSRLSWQQCPDHWWTSPQNCLLALSLRSWTFSAGTVCRRLVLVSRQSWYQNCLNLLLLWRQDSAATVSLRLVIEFDILGIMFASSNFDSRIVFASSKLDCKE